MKLKSAPWSYTLQHTEKEWCSEGVPVLKATFSVPQCQGLSHAQRRLNRFYLQYNRSFSFYCTHTLYPEALALRRADASDLCAEAALDTHLTYQCGDCLSTYTDCTEWCKTPQALTLRHSENWRGGVPLSLRECFPPSDSLRAIRRRCVEAAMEQCSQQRSTDLYRFRPKLLTHLRRCFNPRSFYLTEEGLCFFYQPFAIAEGGVVCPTFFLPFSQETGPFPPLSAP